MDRTIKLFLGVIAASLVLLNLQLGVITLNAFTEIRETVASKGRLGRHGLKGRNLEYRMIEEGIGEVAAAIDRTNAPKSQGLNSSDSMMIANGFNNVARAISSVAVPSTPPPSAIGLFEIASAIHGIDCSH